MSYQLLCQNSLSGTVYDITTLASGISHETSLSGGQPGKLTFSTSEDPNNVLEMVCGSIINFSVDGIGVFYGYIFTMDADEKGNYKITAYDQMRYLKNKEVYITSGMTASEIFELVCRDVYPGVRESVSGDTYKPASLPYRVVVPSAFVVPEYLHDGKTLFEIIEYGIDRTNVAEMQKPIADREFFFMKDKFGELQFTTLAQEKTDLIIGDRSLLTSYQYSISIDKDTYNSVVIYRDNEKTAKREIWLEFDSDTQKQWGKLQMIEKAADELNEAQIRELANNYMKLYNRETKTMKLNANGHKQLIAGSGFTLSLDSLGIKQDMWILSATHSYEKDKHTMALSVYI